MSIDVTPAPVTVVLVADETNVVVDAAPAVVTLLPAPVVVPVVPSIVEIVVAAPGVPGAPGAQGPEGGRSAAVAKAPINAHTVVAVDPDGLARPASSDDILDPDRVLGIALYAALPGETVVCTRDGEIVGTVALGLLYLDTDGSLTTNPDTGAVCFRVARGLPGRFVVDLALPIVH